MIPMLLAAARITSGGLQMSVGSGTNPHISPGRWNCERLDARQVFGIAQFLPVDAEVSEAFAVALAREARRLIGDISQADGPGRPGRFCRERRNVWHISQTHKGE